MSSQSEYRLSLYFWLVCFIYFTTGLTALSYEVLWARILSTLFGVSIFGIVVTISAFLAGLGVGSIAGKLSLSKISNPLRLFAVIELFVALFAFNLPTILTALDSSLSGFSSESFSAWVSIQAVVTFILMFIPAFALGFGFPLILSTLKQSKISVGTIYALNTLGGVIGAVMPLMLLPLAGWVVSVRLVAILAIVAAILAFILSILLKAQTQESKNKSIVRAQPSISFLLCYAVIGGAAIMLEIAWTRLYGMFLLRTEYVMAIILASFLLGIGLGSLFASRIKNTKWIIFLPALVAFSALLSLISLPYVAEWSEAATYASLGEAVLMQGAIVALITFPATLAFGAWFPLLVAQYVDKDHSGALIYGANSIGAALGGLIAGFIILPTLGTALLIVLSLAAVLTASLYWLKAWNYKVGALVVLLLTVPFANLPGIEKLLPDSQADAKNLFFYEDAMSLTHVVEKKSGERLLLADLQRMDASTDPTAIRVQKNQARLPLLLHSAPQDVLFLGLGTGITAAGSLPLEDLNRTSVELSKGAIEAAKTYFSEANGNIAQKITIVRDDARRFLKSTAQNFDVIIGDLFHPDLVGRSELLTVQQFERARSKLRENGLFVQWLALNQFDLPTLKVVLATFQSAFPEAYLFVDGFRLAMVGLNGHFDGVNAMKANLSRLDAMKSQEMTGGEGVWSWAGRYWGPIKGVSNNKIQDEWAPVIEFQLPKTKFNRQNHLVPLLQFLLSVRADKDNAVRTMGIADKDLNTFEQVLTASNLYYQSWLAYFSNDHLESQRLLSMAYSANPDDQWIGFGMADAMYASIDQAAQQGVDRKSALERILSIRPDHLPALMSLKAHFIQLGNTGAAEEIDSKINNLTVY